MKTFTKLSLTDSETVLIETECNEEVIRAANVGEIFDKTQVQLKDALAKVKPIAASIFEALRDPIAAPREIEVEFGVKLSAEANVLISSTAAEGHFKIALKWTK